MPAHRKQKWQLEANGAFEHDPKRKKARELEPIPTIKLGSPPKYFTKKQIDCWNEIVDSSLDGVLFASDSFTLEVAAVLMAEFRSKKGLSGASMAHLIKTLGLLGLNPQDRTKLKVEPVKQPKKEDPWASL